MRIGKEGCHLFSLTFFPISFLGGWRSVAGFFFSFLFFQFFHFIFGHYFRSLSFSLFLSLSFPRCILRWPDLHVSKIAKKRSSKFHLSVNSAFEQVLAGVNKQHGSNWIYPPIQQVLRCLHTAPKGAYEVSDHLPFQQKRMHQH